MQSNVWKGRRRGAQVLAVLSAIAGLVVFATSGVGSAAVAPIVDYSTYPPSLPASCQATGAGTLTGLTFSNGTETSTSLRDLPLVPGQSFSMSWTGFAPGCEGVGVGLSSKIAMVPTFEQSADYWLFDFAYCGPEAGAEPCGSSPYQLDLQVPPASASPCYQLDAHVGPPLGQVGPTAAYYGFLNGERDLLISAQNGGTEPCGPLPPCESNPELPATAFLCTQQATTTTEGPTTTEAPGQTTTTITTTPPPVSTSTPSVPACATNPALPADSPQCAPSVTTTPAGPTTTSAPRCASNPALPADSPNCVSVQGIQAEACGPGQVRNATTGACVASGGALPVTGRDSGSLAATGALLLLSGLCIAYAYRRPEGVNATS